MKIHTLTIVGVGLIGGSIGLAAKKRGLAAQVWGAGRSQATLDRARSRGAIDTASLDINGAVSRAEIVVLCLPVDGIAEHVLRVAPLCAPGALLTDAGSTKASIVRAVEGRLPPGVAFVGSHPLAGSEKQGVEHADADMFQDRWTVVTPTEMTDPKAVERTREFWEALGARVKVMSPEEHDRCLAITSHVPHLTAAALAGILPEQLADLAASGFRDTTRIAAGDPALWSAILLDNRGPILEAFGPLVHRLQDFRRALESMDRAAVNELLTHARKVRNALGN